MKSKASNVFSKFLLLGVGSLALAVIAQAADYTWGGGSSNWADTSTTGWNGGPPGSGDTATINSGTVTTSVGSQQNGVVLTIGAGGVLNDPNYMYFGPSGSLTLNSGTIHVTTNHGFNYGWYDASLSLTVNANTGSSSINGSGGIRLEGNTTFSGDGNLTIGLGLHNFTTGYGDFPATNVVKQGTGTLTLSGVSDYSGGTTVNGGRLILATGNAGGTGRIQGALAINDGATVETTGDGTGLGWVDQISSVSIHGGTLTTAGIMHIWNISGGISMTGGTLQSNNGSSDPNGPQLEWNRTSVTTHASADTATIAGRIRMRADSGYTGISFTVADGGATDDLLVSASVTEASGGLGLTKSGDGTMRLTGANNHTGIADILDGTLVAASNTALGAGGWNAANMTWIRDGATLALQGGISLDEHLHLTGSGAGGLGALRSISGDNSMTLTYGGGGSGPGFCLDGDATIGVEADTFSLTGFYQDTGSYGFTKVGNGTLRLTQASTHTGGTTINAGTIKASADQALGGASSTLTVNGGSLDLDGHAQTLAALDGGTSGLVHGGSAAISMLTVGNGYASSSFGGTLTGNLALVKTGTGTLTLTGQVATTAMITVEQGTLDLSAATLSAGVKINASPQSVVKLPAAAIGKLYLDNVKLSPGRWGAPGSVAAGLADFESSVFSGSGVVTVPDTGLSLRERWKTMKHGLFVHYVWDGSGGVTHNADGSSPTSVNDVADRFDAAGFANDLESMGVEYIIFTAWHSLFYPLFNSSAMERYYPGRCPICANLRVI